LDFLKSGKANSAISLDVGTEFVKALIFEIKEGEAQVLGVGRARQKLTDMQGGAVTDISEVIENCRKAISQAEEEAGFLPDQTVIGIAGELVKGITTTVHYTRQQTKTKITMQELKNIIDKVQSRAYEKAREILAEETGQAEIDVRLVNAAIVDVSIDSYKVTNPLDFQGRDISVSIFNAFAPVVHLGALQSIAQDLGLDLLTITAEPYAVARSVGMEDTEDFSGIFIDIGGGTTDVAVVRNGGLEGTKMFALGGRTFTKRVATDLDIPFGTAEEVKLNYSLGRLDKKSSELIKKSLANDCMVWRSGIELTLSEFEALENLPSRILLCGGGSMLPDIKDVLENDWEPELAFAKKPKVEFIRPIDVSAVVDKTGKLNKPSDVTPMALANIARDFAGKEEVAEGILRKIVQSMKE
jgi:cell division protein FtsA